MRNCLHEVNCNLNYYCKMNYLKTAVTELLIIPVKLNNTICNGSEKSVIFFHPTTQLMPNITLMFCIYNNNNTDNNHIIII